MSHLLNPRHEAFCQEYVRGPHAGNFTASYEAAGYQRDDANASKLAGQSHIKRRIDELVAEDAAADRQATQMAAASLAVDKYKVINELSKIGFASITDCLYVGEDDCAHFDLARISSDQAAAIKGAKIQYYKGKEGEPQQIKSVNVALFDKRIALGQLANQLATLPDEEEIALGDELTRKPLNELTLEELDVLFLAVVAALWAQRVNISSRFDHAMAAVNHGYGNPKHRALAEQWDTEHGEKEKGEKKHSPDSGENPVVA